MLEKLIDFIFSVLPQRSPTSLKAKNVKLVAHRGAHKYKVKENTLKGFEICIEHGLWGIEFDIRWTKDYEPILLHDNNAKHVFNRPDVIPSQLTILELKKEIPDIPTLEEVVQKFGQKIHFMIELKECFSSHSHQIERLMKVLSALRPIHEYHFLSLHPRELLSLSGVTKKALIGVSTLNTKTIAQFVKASSLGGHCGHYLLLNRRLQKEHESAFQKVGTGYISSKNSLYREIQRGVEWIFTNNPIEIQNELNKII